jgi:hypothetical protein
MMTLRIAALFLACALLLPAATPASSQTPALSFLDEFNGNPAAPEPFASPRWHTLVHTRNNGPGIGPVEAHHGPDCSPPMATHTVTTRPEAIFICRNHLMTALDAGDYGAIYLTPDHLADFSQGEATIRFDISTFRSSLRDWWNVWITPYEDYALLPLDEHAPDGYGAPRRAVNFSLHRSHGGSSLLPTIYRDGRPTADFDGVSPDSFTGVDEVLAPSAVVRTTFEIRISQTHLKVGLPAQGVWWVDQPIEPLDWSRGVVQFGHHSYTPDKDCYPELNSPPGGPCTANTWHWDNVSISPAAPFTLIGVDENPDQAIASGGGVAFARPAPVGATLRFHAAGEAVRVRFDGGEWSDATMMTTFRAARDIDPYTVPIPAGATRAEFEVSPWWGGDGFIKDVVVTAFDGAGAAPPVGSSCYT